MKEFFELLFKFDLNSIFFKPTENGFLKFFRYAFVGGIAFVIDYLFFVIFNILFLNITDSKELSVAVGTTAGFIAGLIVNFILSKKFVFTEKANVGSKGEFMAYFVIGLIGYFINMGLMQLFIIKINEYISKVIVAIIVLVYNYTARKYILYTNREDKK